jgi:hypothetical protein
LDQRAFWILEYAKMIGSVEDLKAFVFMVLESQYQTPVADTDALCIAMTTALIVSL